MGGKTAWVSMPNDADILVTDQHPESSGAFHAEEERALEAVAQSLREPLIDQLNWCTLLTSDSEPSLHAKHLELVAKINLTANDLLGQVQDLLDVDKIQERIQSAKLAAANSGRRGFGRRTGGCGIRGCGNRKQRPRKRCRPKRTLLRLRLLLSRSLLPDC